jgi:hypothetical protein
MSSRWLTCLFAATALFSIGCDDSSGLDDDQAANIRVVNASPATGEVDVLVNGTVRDNASNVTFLNGSAQCVRVDADDPQVTFQQTGGTVSIPAQTFTFDAGGRNTVVFAGTNSTNFRVINLSDPVTPDLDADEARIRVVNARAATSMGVTITPFSGTVGTPQTINTTTSPASAWVVVPASQPVAVRLTTTGGAVIDVLNIVPTAGQELILTAADPATGTSAIQWTVTSACSRP